MSLGPAEVEKIALLARLAISPDDVPNYAHDLSAILDFVEQMNAVDTDGVEPMAHPLLDMTQRFRHDVVIESSQRDQFLATAPLSQAGLYLVPKVIE